MERKILYYFLNIITLLIIVNKVNAINIENCSIQNEDEKECLHACQENSDINCVQWRCNNLKSMLINLNFNSVELENIKNNIINAPDCYVPANGIIAYDQNKEVIEM